MVSKVYKADVWLYFTKYKNVWYSFVICSPFPIGKVHLTAQSCVTANIQKNLQKATRSIVSLVNEMLVNHKLQCTSSNFQVALTVYLYNSVLFSSEKRHWVKCLAQEHNTWPQSAVTPTISRLPRRPLIRKPLIVLKILVSSFSVGHPSLLNHDIMHKTWLVKPLRNILRTLYLTTQINLKIKA